MEKQEQRYDKDWIKERLEGELNLCSNLTGKPLHLELSQLPDGNVAVTDCEKNIYMNPSSPIIDGNVDEGRKTAVARALFQHEVAHIWLDSGRATGPEVEQKLKEEYPKLASMVPDICNVLEDYRIESVWRIFFPGSVRNFSMLYDSTIKGLEKKVADSIGGPDIIDALLIARFGLSGASVIGLEKRFNDQLMEKYDSIMKELKKLDGADWTATYIVARNMLKMISDDAEKNSGDAGDTERKTAELTKSLLEGAKINILTNDMQPGANDKEPSKDILQKLNNISKKSEEEALDESRKKINELVKSVLDSQANIANLTKMNESDWGNLGPYPPTAQHTSNRGAGGSNQENFEETYGLGNQEYAGPPISPNPRILALLKRIAGKGTDAYGLGRGFILRESGTEPNIAAIIPYLAGEEEYRKELFKEKQRRQKIAEIWLIMDISGSMEGKNLALEKNIIASTYDSVKNSNIIKIRLFGFYGDSSASHAFEFDRKKLLDLSTGSGTPTNVALRYIRDKLRKEAQQDPIVVLLTDGRPDDDQATMEALADLMQARRNISFFTLFVTDSPKAEIWETFKDSTKVFIIKSFEEVREKLVNIVLEAIRREAAKKAKRN